MEVSLVKQNEEEIFFVHTQFATYIHPILVPYVHFTGGINAL